MQFNYKAKIVKILPNSLLVEFSRFGGSTHVVGTPILPQDEDPAKFLRQYAPVHIWMEEMVPRRVCVEGQEFTDLVVINQPVPVEASVPSPTITLTASIV